VICKRNNMWWSCGIYPGNGKLIQHLKPNNEICHIYTIKMEIHVIISVDAHSEGSQIHYGENVQASLWKRPAREALRPPTNSQHKLASQPVSKLPCGSWSLSLALRWWHHVWYLSAISWETPHKITQPNSLQWKINYHVKPLTFEMI
jgi:hypothetical protein